MPDHLRVLDLPADAPLPSDLLLDLGQRRVDLVLLRKVVDPAALATVVDRLESRRTKLPWVWQESDDEQRIQMALLGASLTPYNAFPDGPPLDWYLEEADRFRALYAELFDGVPDLLARVAQVFATIGGGRPVGEPQAPDGRSFTPATFRRVPPSKGIPTHVGRWFQQTGGYAPLRPLVDLSWQCSWFVPLQQGESGGELVVYDLQWGDPDVPWLERDRVLDADAIDARWRAQAVRPDPGDLLVFDGGRFFHKVSVVGGARPRHTFGGFVGLSADGSRVLRWN
ncbi:MAG: hypothetical protein H6742_07735 [Alphaproteobacteria bacterium]|nr:hypothetical protein [Alphaproteobacteria bacterium]